MQVRLSNLSAQLLIVFTASQMPQEPFGAYRGSRRSSLVTCRIETKALKEVDHWLEDYRRMWDERLDRLEDYLHQLQSKEKKHGRKK